MAVHSNSDIADRFDEIADLLEIEGANPFRIRAYRNASRMLRSLGVEVAEMLRKGTPLTDLPGVGEDLAGKMAEIAESGKCTMLDKLHKKFPPALSELLKIPGLGPKRVGVLYHELDVRTVPQLHRAAKDGRIRDLPGFGLVTEKRVLEALEAQAPSHGRFKIAVAAPIAEDLVTYLKATPGVERVVVAGSFRRASETVGDLDILVIAKDSTAAMERFASYRDVARVVAKGPTRATVMLRSGLQVDLRVVPEESFGAALYYFTGSKAHNIAVRRIAQKRGLKINEYGVFRGAKRVAGDTEESILKLLGLRPIPPELRENRGEIEAAAKGELPKLVEEKDLKGDLHIHSKATGGHNTIREMAKAAQARSLEYIAITEHSLHAADGKGLDAKRLAKQMAEIDALNGEKPGAVVLKGIEVDILEDGTLDLSDDALADLDLVVAAIHSGFKLSREKQTKRILKAMERPHFTILAHPGGRLLSEREPYDVDMGRVIRAAKERGCFLELNAHPDRLDLTAPYCQMAKEEGVLVSVNSDAHSVQDFANLRFGIGQARRGWLEKGDVLNARPLKALRPLLARTM